MGKRNKGSIPSQFRRNALTKSEFKKRSDFSTKSSTSSMPKTLDISEFVNVIKEYLHSKHLQINDNIFTTKESCEISSRVLLYSDCALITFRYLVDNKFLDAKVYKSEFLSFFNITEDTTSKLLQSMLYYIAGLYTWIRLQFLHSECSGGYLKPLMYTSALDKSMIKNPLYNLSSVQRQLESMIRFNTPNFKQEYQIIRDLLIIGVNNFDFRSIPKQKYVSLFNVISKSEKDSKVFKGAIEKAILETAFSYFKEDTDIKDEKSVPYDYNVSFGKLNLTVHSRPYEFPINLKEFENECIIHPEFVSNDLIEQYIPYFDTKKALQFLPKPKGIFSGNDGSFLCYEVIENSKVSIMVTSLSTLTGDLCEVFAFDIDCDDIIQFLVGGRSKHFQIRASKGSIVLFWYNLLNHLYGGKASVQLEQDQILTLPLLPKLKDTPILRKYGLSISRAIRVMEETFFDTGIDTIFHDKDITQYLVLGDSVLFHLIEYYSNRFLTWVLLLQLNNCGMCNMNIEEYKYSPAETISDEYSWILSKPPKNLNIGYSRPIPVNEYLIPLDRKAYFFSINDKGKHFLKVLSDNKSYKISDVFKFTESPLLLFDKKDIFKYLLILIRLGKEGSPFIQVSEELYNEEFSQKIDQFSENLSGNSLESIDIDIVNSLIQLVSFKFKFVFDGIKMCEAKEFNSNSADSLTGLYINRLGDSLEIYEYSSESGELSINSEYFMDFVDTIQFRFTDSGFVETNLYSVESERLVQCGEIGKTVASVKLHRVSETLFVYIFFSILFLDKKRIQVIANNVKNGKVTTSIDNLKDDIPEDKVSYKKTEFKDNINDDVSDDKVSYKKTESKDKSTQHSEEDLALLDSINLDQFDYLTESKEISGVRIISLKNLFFTNIEKVFKGQNILNRLKPKYKLKSWNVNGHIRHYKSGKQVYIAPHKNNRNTNLLEENYIDYQQKVITADDFKESHLF